MSSAREGGPSDRSVENRLQALAAEFDAEVSEEDLRRFAATTLARLGLSETPKASSQNTGGEQ